MIHLAYCDNAGKKGERALDQILAGSITMLVRGAAGRKIPHSRVNEGEKIYFMEKGTARITAYGIVKSVQNYVNLNDQEIEAQLELNQPKLKLTQKQKQSWHRKCLCFIEFENVQQIAALYFELPGSMADWLILDKIEDVVAGTNNSNA